MAEFDTVVVGNGLFGSAAARHLSQLGERVALIGPDEPPDQSRHRGVFSSHYDQGRLTRLQDRTSSSAALTRRAIENYASLEEASGVRFHYPVGALIVGDPSSDADGSGDDALTRVREDGIVHDYYEPGDSAWRARFPQFEFPDSHYVIHEPSPAGFINPRRLIQAQNVVAAAHGATVIRDVVTRLRSSGTGVSAKTQANTTVTARKALVAAGAFTNFNDLLPLQLPLEIKTEVVVLGRVDNATAERLSGAPTIKYAIDDLVLEGIYVVPPLRYPDGDHYIKLGANTSADLYPTTLAEVQDWFRHGDSDICRPSFEGALRAMWPDTEFRSVETKRCILCRTADTHPIIDRVDDSVFVATAGNGGGAKGSDVWGELAAGLVHDGSWPADLAPMSI